MITSQELRQKFLDFMATKGHTIIPSASLLPKEDPTLLFVNSGMYPLVPYLMGQEHPSGTRIADSQKVIRTVDIDEVGDNRHLSFFEMLGSWSLGDYGKKESIEWGFEFLTGKKWLGIDPRRLFVTVYKGGEAAKADDEAAEVWKNCFASLGLTADIGDEYDFKSGLKAKGGEKYIYRITRKSGSDNWWGLPYRGPCGPCSEIYYLLGDNELDFEVSFENKDIAQIEDFIENQIMEIWNHVFMEFEGEWMDGIKEPKNLVPLAKKNIDTGMGFERLLVVLNNVDTVHKTDSLSPIIDVVQKWSLV